MTLTLQGELWQPGELAAAVGESELLWPGLPEHLPHDLPALHECAHHHGFPPEDLPNLP